MKKQGGLLMQDIASAVDTNLKIEIDESRHNLTAAPLVEEAIRNGEGMLAADGALVVSTGQYTGRSPKDKFVVEEPSSKDKIWWGSVNQPLSEENFDKIRARMAEYIGRQETLRTGRIRGCGPQLPPLGAHLYRDRLGQPLRPQPLHPPHPGRACRFQARFRGGGHAFFQG